MHDRDGRYVVQIINKRFLCLFTINSVDSPCSFCILQKLIELFMDPVFHDSQKSDFVIQKKSSSSPSSSTTTFFAYTFMRGCVRIHQTFTLNYFIVKPINKWISNYKMKMFASILEWFSIRFKRHVYQFFAYQSD